MSSGWKKVKDLKELAKCIDKTVMYQKTVGILRYAKGEYFVLHNDSNLQGYYPSYIRDSKCEYAYCLGTGEYAVELRLFQVRTNFIGEL